MAACSEGTRPRGHPVQLLLGAGITPFDSTVVKMPPKLGRRAGEPPSTGIRGTLNAACTYLYLLGSCLFTADAVAKKFDLDDFKSALESMHASCVPIPIGPVKLLFAALGRHVYTRRRIHAYTCAGASAFPRSWSDVVSSRARSR